MGSDVWVYDIESQSWREVKAHGDSKPAARGWFAADILRELTEDRIVVQPRGNEREAGGYLGVGSLLRTILGCTGVQWYDLVGAPHYLGMLPLG